MRAEPPVAERTVPAEVTERVRATLMVTAQESTPRHRFTVVWAAATLVVLLAVVGVVVGYRSDAGLIAAPAPLPPVSTAYDQTVTTDLGPLTAADTDATLAKCLRPEDPAVAEVVTARRLTDGQTPFSWVAYENVDDQLVTCSNRLHGPTRGGERKFRPTTRYPVVALGGMQSGSWLPDQSAPDPTSATDFTSALLFAAGPDVATVQVRVIVEGVPGAWFTGKVTNGFVLIPFFEAGPIALDPQGEPQVQLERRAFDQTGTPVRIKP